MRNRVYLSFLMAVWVIHTGCTSRPTEEPKKEPRVVSFFPDHYQAARVVGSEFLSRTGCQILVNPSEGFIQLKKNDDSARIPFPPGDSRPVLPLRLTGPSGTIQENFLVATGYNGPLSISRQDAQVLGLTGRSMGNEISLTKRDGPGNFTRFYCQAPVKVEMQELEIEETFPAIWLPPEIEDSNFSPKNKSERREP